MDVLQAISERRAVRAYTDEELDRATVERLIHSAVQAPSAMDLEPWAFVVFEGKGRLRGFSEQARRVLLANPEEGESRRCGPCSRIRPSTSSTTPRCSS